MSMLLQQGFPAPPAPPPIPDFTGAQDVIVRTDPSILATLPPPAQFMIVALGIIAVVIILFPLARAIARRIDRGAQQADIDPAEFEEMRHRIAELEQRQSQVRELEERVDFAERLLADRTRDGLRIERGGGGA